MVVEKPVREYHLMIRRRLYNPAQLEPDELKASFIARRETLAEMLQLLREQKSGRPCQHMLLIGSRGMGKTTLGLRFLHTIGETPDLAKTWQPVAFHEESYQIANLADFWLTALDHLARATADTLWADKAEALATDETDTERLAAYALSALLDFCRAGGKRLILFVENLDLIFRQLGDEREVHALRAALIEHSEILLVGSANSVFEAIQHRGEPFYEFFRLFLLKGLEQDEYIQIFQALTEQEDLEGVPKILDRQRGRLETIRRLTGGNPRLLVLAYRILIESPLGSAFKDLERLIDEQTPYFKSRIEELPIQGRKVFHCLAEGWRPMLAREVSVSTRLSSSHTSAQLKQLVNKGYVREIRSKQEKRIRYEVSDRFYNIYFLLRFSRKGRRRLELLVTFLNDLFGPAPMRYMYLATLEDLTEGTPTDEEISDWLGVLAPYVANDSDFTERENWRNKAISLIINKIGENAPVLGKIERIFSRQDNVRRGIELFNSGHFAEAETACRELMSQEPDNLSVRVLLGSVLIQRERFEDAIATFEHVVDTVGPDDTAESRICAVGALAGKSKALLHLKRLAAAAAAVREISRLVGQQDLPALRNEAAEAFRSHGELLAKMNRHEEAIAAWWQSSGYVSPDDPRELRLIAVGALFARGKALTAREQHDKAVSTWERLTQNVHVNDSAELRYQAIIALIWLGTEYLKLEQYEDWITSSDRLSRYVHKDDSIEIRQILAILLATSSNIMNNMGHSDDSELNCRKAIQLDPECAMAWHTMAKTILGRDDAARLSEAENCARRTVELATQGPAAFHVLSDILARRGKWPEALEMMDRALLAASQTQDQNWNSFTKSLISFAAAGWVPKVKQMMENYPALAETMEPLWHAVREEMGEKLEPLPAEVMDAVTDIRQKFAEKRRYLASKPIL